MKLTCFTYKRTRHGFVFRMSRLVITNTTNINKEAVKAIYISMPRVAHTTHIGPRLPGSIVGIDFTQEVKERYG